VPHFVETFAVRITSDDSGDLVYSADTRPGDEIVEAARDADLLFIEGTLPRPERTGNRGHLTPEEAGAHAREAGARRVVITHISDELGEDWAREEAEKGFGAPVEIAREGAVYEV
jgi:ribonuclease BN (tRNA processing enzyme)